MSFRKTAVVSEWKSEGNGVQKEVEGMLLAKDQKDLLVKEEERLSHFLWIKRMLHLTNNIFAMILSGDEC